MALIKFNRTAKKAVAIGSSKDADTLYFPTDEQSVYLNGKRVGGDRVSHADAADTATTAGSATTAETANRATNANHATSADHATNADNAINATNAGTAGKVGHTLTLKLNNGSAQTFNGSADVTFNVTPSGIGAAPTSHNHDKTYSKIGHTHTASEVGAAPSNHTHDINNITHAGAAAKRGVDTLITTLSSDNLPTSDAVRDYVDSQIKNYTSAFRYAGTLGLLSNAWQVTNIPSDISETDHMSFATFTEGGEYALLKVGFTFYVNMGGEFVNGEVVEPGDMVTCVGLYDGEGGWSPSYHIVNGNITVTEQVDESTKVPTAKAVKSAINTAITTKINALDNTLSATSGNAITGITQENGLIISITETPVNNYTHPSHTATTGVPTANAAPGFGGTFQVNQISSDSQGHVILNKAQTITIPATLATTSDRGLMSSAQVGDLNQAKTDIQTLLDALTWK